MSLGSAVYRLLTTCLGFREGESCLVVCDPSRKDLGEAVYHGAREVGTRATLSIIEPPGPDGWQQQTLLELEEQMLEHDVTVLLTGRSLSHTDARRRAVAGGARLVSMPGINRDLFLRATQAVYDEVAKISRRLKDIFTAGETVHVSTDLGTEVTFSVSGMQGHSEDGLYSRSGRWGNLPAGEACVGPREGTAEGVIVIDWSMSGVGRLQGPLVIRVANGRAVEITGRDADRLLTRLEPFGGVAFTLAEFGLGTNRQARLSGVVLEDEKVLGTAHFALGNNITFGGSADAGVHLDGVLTHPSVAVDGRPIMEHGRHLLRETS